MLQHVGRDDLARRLGAGVAQALNEDMARTGDLGGTASTKEFAQAVIRRAVTGA